MGNSKRHISAKNTIHYAMLQSIDDVVPLFKKKSKKLLADKVSDEKIRSTYSHYIDKLLLSDNEEGLDEFCDLFYMLLKDDADQMELYMLFVNSYILEMNNNIVNDRSKIGVKALKEFYEKLDKVNHKVVEHCQKKKIHKSQLELQDMFDAITDPLIVVDKELNILRINKYLKDALDLKEYKEILGKKANRIKYEGRPLCLKEDVKEVYDRCSVHQSEMYSDDEKKFYTQYIYPISSGENCCEDMPVLVYKKDMTRHRAMEEEILHLDRLATIGRLSTVIAHEIRNPLSGIGLSASLLKKKLSTDWQHFDTLENILDGIDRIESIILRLLDFSKPKKTKRCKTDILDPLREATFFIRLRAQKRSIKIKEKCPDSIPPVFVDPDQMTQVLVNILLNAVQSIEKGGTISIDISLGSDFSVILEITDDGTGIKSDDLPRIFEPFFTTKVDGTGLGLTITKNILDQNDIDISYESDEKAGTACTLTIKAYNEI